MAIRKTNGGRWEARWREPGTRKVKGKTFARKRDAEQFLARIEVAKATGAYVDPGLGRTTLAAWWERFSKTCTTIKPSTRDRYSGLMQKQVLPYLGTRRLGSITRLDVEAWLSQLVAEGTSPATAANAHRTLRLVLQGAVNGNIIAANPARGVKAPKAPHKEMRFLTVDEVEAVAAAVPPRYRALILLLAWTGLRIGEAAALRMENLDLLRGHLKVTEAYAEVRGLLILGSTKNHEMRSVTLPPFLVAELRRHVEAFPPNVAGLVFTGKQGGAIRHSAFRYRVWLPAVQAAGIRAPRPRVHDLRHTSVALAIRAGAHPKEIQARAGHSSIVVTMDRYGHLFPGQDKALAESLEGLRSTVGSDVVVQRWCAEDSNVTPLRADTL